MSEKPENPLSLASSISKVIDGLKKQPVLLFTFGIAIVLLAAGALAFDKFRLILVGLLVLAVFGLVAWTFIQANKTVKRGKMASPRAVDIEIEKSKLDQSHLIGERGKSATNSGNVTIKISDSEVTGSDVIGSDKTKAEEK